MVKETILSPHEVREILNSDNKEIIRLCKLASITPRQNAKGFTYFSYDEVRRLKELREAYKASILNSKHFKVLQNLKNSFYNLENGIINSSSEDILNNINHLESFFEEYENFKSENETLKLKMAKITKENCYLKDRLNEFKPLGMGVYIKNKKRDYSI